MSSKINSAEACLPLDSATEAAVLKMSLELEDAPLKPIKCYRLQPSRVARYASLPGCQKLTADNGIALTCVDEDGHTRETILLKEPDGNLQLTFKDAISWEDLALPDLVEAQFSADGPWLMALADRQGIEALAEVAFKMWVKMADEIPPSCASSFRRMLQTGPTNRLYAEGDKRVVRMPETELPDWQNTVMKNGKEVVVDVPRTVYALRAWDATNRQYVEVDATLEGAPTSDAGMEKWYVEWIRRLKSVLPSAWVDAMATSTRHTTHKDISKGLGGVEPMDVGAFSNRWTKLCLATTAPVVVGATARNTSAT